MSAIGQPRRRGVNLTPDDPILRRVEQAFTSTRVDPLFRRRLRSQVVNHYVAVREGHTAARPLSHHGMMGRLGRACLYASLALAGSSAGVLAASQSALPGDMLYDVKIRIDELRLEAAPADLRTAVAGYIVDARLNEAMVLAADGEWARAMVAAEAAGASTEHMAALLAADPDVEARIQAHLAVLAGLIDSAPAAAQTALQHAITASGAALADAPRASNGNGSSGTNRNGNGNGSGSGSGNGSGSGANGNGNSGADADASAEPDAHATPSAAATPPAVPPGQDDDSDAVDDGGDTGDDPGADSSAHTTPRASPPIPSHAASH
jgi:hypothetical protein